jgi:phospholipid-binding lipoprotein MlaA
LKPIQYICLVLSFLLLGVSVSYSQEEPAASTAPSSEISQVANTEEKSSMPDQTVPDTVKEPEQEPSDDMDEYAAEEKEEPVRIADPLAPWNKAMYHFNDKLYFWALKPVAQGYSAVVPEDMRISFSNFFSNLTTPIRFVSSLLQLKVKDAGNELVRLVYNSTAGIGGLADVAKTDLGISRKDEDLGQTFGKYGIGQGFYIVWPILGPSSLRDSVGTVGDWFLDPVDYVNPFFFDALAIRTFDKVNTVSLHIGDYEDLKKSAIDPYVSLRNAYIQYRKKKVEE